MDDDFGNIYEAWRVMIEESDKMWREEDKIPLNIFAAIRWVGASSCPLSHAYGKPGERFAMLEPTASHGTSESLGLGGLLVLVGWVGVHMNRFSRDMPTHIPSHHPTAGWEEYLKRVMRRWVNIRSKDGSRPKPHWAKWDAEWTPEVIPYIKVRACGGGWVGTREEDGGDDNIRFLRLRTVY